MSLPEIRSPSPTLTSLIIQSISQQPKHTEMLDQNDTNDPNCKDSDDTSSISDPEATVYSHDVTIAAFRDYYRFLVESYMDPIELIEPPEGGWPSITSDFQCAFGRSDEVIKLLRHLLYIRSDYFLGERYLSQVTLAD